MQLDNRDIYVDGDAITVRGGCELFLTNSHIVASGTGIIVQDATVHISNSTVEGGNASFQADDRAKMYVRGSTFAGVPRRAELAMVQDQGGKSGAEPRSANGYNGFPSLSSKTSTPCVPEHAPAEIGEIGDVQLAALATHQVDQLALERIAQGVRHAGRRKRHEVAGCDFELVAVDAREAAPFKDVDPLLFLPVRVIGKRFLARRDAREVHPVRFRPVALPIW